MRIAIVGSGLAGLAAGTWLSRAGHHVELFEATSRPGGRAVSIRRRNSSDRVDVGTQYFHSNYKRALRLIDELGLTKDLYKIRGKTRFFDDRAITGTFVTGHRLPYIAAGSPMANLSMLLKGAFRLLRNPINPFAILNGNTMDTVAADSVISDPFEWEYNVRTLVSAGALVEPEAGDVSFLHLIRLMRIIVTTDYLTLNSGIASLHQKLAASLTVHYDTPVQSLCQKGDVSTGVVISADDVREFDHTIIATTASCAARVLPEAWKAERYFLQSVKQPKAMIVTLFLNRKLEHDVWSYVFRPGPQKAVSFCVDAAQKNPNMVPSNMAALQAWICHPASDRLFSLSDEDITQTAIDELVEYFPNLRADIEEVHVHRVPEAVPQTPPGHNKAAARLLRAMDKRKGIEICGDYLSGGYMECALWSAERAVKRIIDN